MIRIARLFIILAVTGITIFWRVFKDAIFVTFLATTLLWAPVNGKKF